MKEGTRIAIALFFVWTVMPTLLFVVLPAIGKALR